MTETQIITIITALTPLYPFLFALAAVLFKWLISRLPGVRQAEVTGIVQTVVQGVEQYGAGKAGPEKKQMAVAMVNTILSGLHITVSPTLADAMIEAAVYGINQSQPISLPTIPVNQAMQTGNGINAVLANG
jgi:hypothetical protein